MVSGPKVRHVWTQDELRELYDMRTDGSDYIDTGKHFGVMSSASSRSPSEATL